MGLRFYIVDERGLKRISQDVVFERSPFSQFADTKQQVIHAHYEWKGGRLLFKLLGTYLSFNSNGFVYLPDAELINAMNLVRASGEVERARVERPRIASLDLHRRVRTLRDEGQWKPSKEHEEAIAADILGSKRPPGTSSIPMLKSVGSKTDARSVNRR